MNRRNRLRASGGVCKPLPKRVRYRLVNQRGEPMPSRLHPVKRKQWQRGLA